MKKAVTKNKRQQAEQELDGIYFLKLVMYVIVGTQWLRFTNDDNQVLFSLPIGLLIGMVFALHDHFRIDRKIEFAVLLVATLIGWFAMVGISIRL